MPDWLWARLTVVADAKGIPVTGLVADAIRQIVDDNPRVKFERVRKLGILEKELIAARAAGYMPPGIHTSSKGKNA